MGAFACAALAHEYVGCAVALHGRGMDDKRAARGRKLREEYACHGVGDKIGVPVMGLQPKGGVRQGFVHVHAPGLLAGMRHKQYGPYGTSIIKGRLAKIVIGYGERLALWQRGGCIACHNPESGARRQLRFRATEERAEIAGHGGL